MKYNSPPPANTQNPDKFSKAINAEIDCMKLIASVTVMFHHSIYATNTDTSRIWWGGYMSVAFFFCVSGYLMANSAFRAAPLSQDELGRDTAKFMIRKIAGILPWYTVAWMISFILSMLPYGVAYVVKPETLLQSIFPTLLIYLAGFDGFEIVGAIWYLSAMYLCMPAIYAFLRARKDLFIWVVAPLLTLFLYGYMHKVYGGFWIAVTWIGLCYGGIIYAVAGLSCGCFCYGVSEWLKRQPLTKFGRILISLLDLVSFIACLVLMQVHPEGAMNAVVAFLFAIVVITSFSGKSYTTGFMDQYCNTAWTRELSIAIYLCNGRTFFIVTKYFPDIESYEQRLLLYVFFTLLISVLSVILVRRMRKWYRRTGRAILCRLFLQTGRS